MMCDLTNFLEPSCAGSVHVVLSSVSGIIFLIIGCIALLRNRNNRLNQISLGFFAFPGSYQIFDALLVFYGANPNSDINVLNLLRDISIGALIIGLAFGALVSLIISYGENVIFNKKFLIIYIIGVLVLLLGGIFGDFISKEIASNEMLPILAIANSSNVYIEINRNAIGWIGISGSFILFTSIIMYELIILLRETSDIILRKKILSLLIGFLLSISILFLFDISFAFSFIEQNLLGIFELHFLMHLGVILGSLLVLSAFLTPTSAIRNVS